MSQNSRRTRRRLSLVKLLALLVTLSLALAACGDDDNDDDNAGGGGGSNTTVAGGGGTTVGGGDGGGAFEINTDDCDTDPAEVAIEGDTIKLGTSLPQSGLYSAFKEILNGANAYIDYVNKEKGGFELAGKKYQVELVAKDDAYEASRTVTNVNELLDSENVFALFNVVGTKNNAAIRDTVNDGCVPSLFAATGSPLWGNHDYPWVEGTLLVPYPLEMQSMVDYLKTEKPNAKIAVLYANDDFGRSYIDTVKALVEGTELSVVAEESYDPEGSDTKAQVTSLAASKADVFVVGATLLACPNALGNAANEGWKPMVFMSGTCTSKTLMNGAGAAGDGVFSVAPLLDPANPANDGNPAMQLYKDKTKSFTQDNENGIVAYGWSVAALLEHTLAQAEAPNRLAVMQAARTLTDVQGIGLQLEGSTWSVGADDWFLGEEFNLVQYSRADGFFKPVGELRKYDDKTEEITPEALING
jgi:branched-chain amino acid transport system substrate-binding protein